jgi:hypothetical protein
MSTGTPLLCKERAIGRTMRGIQPRRRTGRFRGFLAFRPVTLFDDHQPNSLSPQRFALTAFLLHKRDYALYVCKVLRSEFVVLNLYVERLLEKSHNV